MFLSLCPHSRLLTANLQFTLHYVFSAVVDRFARIHSPVEWTGLTDLQRQDALLTEHPVLGFICDVHLVLVPGHFGLIREDRHYLYIFHSLQYSCS